ncbi:MAG: CDF family Co(II)/Ni(II) efflux transporter DmeF [Sphingomonas sp.]|uniref:CDF family Co(II)/Ni(II) efflux transporter DmeF n=1 Tax=Sphingomonas sp. TaxID=28214 RepID=UPI002274FE2D|nr:CDF family Co(II)/Ni(II) efflux transporter DmeF [Sphingomonas sp.]MCX8475864.1 CDF family Co(II)/Ni(II) efflux transporter DmeF [Sphingomonas sp.]
MHIETLSTHGHSHAFLGDAHDEHERRTRWVVALTAAMMVVEIAAGWLTGSMALLADGLHMATHAGALGVAALAYAFARRHAENPRFTFGTGKVGDLAGFASALVLALIALGIGVESVGRLLVPATVDYAPALWIAALGLAVNLASAWLLGDDHHGHSHDHGQLHDHEHAHADNNLRSAYAHVLADALTSLLAIVALLAGWFLGWTWMDAAMGIVGALVIARWSWGLLRDTAAVLLDASANPALEAEIREAMTDGDAEIADLHVWRVGPGRYAAIVSLVAADPLSPSDYAARVTIHEELVHVTVEVHRCPGEHPRLRRAA